MQKFKAAENKLQEQAENQNAMKQEIDKLRKSCADEKEVNNNITYHHFFSFLQYSHYVANVYVPVCNRSRRTFSQRWTMSKPSVLI